MLAGGAAIGGARALGRAALGAVCAGTSMGSAASITEAEAGYHPTDPQIAWQLSRFGVWIDDVKDGFEGIRALAINTWARSTSERQHHLGRSAGFRRHFKRLNAKQR